MISRKIVACTPPAHVATKGSDYATRSYSMPPNNSLQAALEHLAGEKEAVRDLREELRDRKQRAKTQPTIGAQASNIRKIVRRLRHHYQTFPSAPGTAGRSSNRLTTWCSTGLAVPRTIEAV